MGALVQDLRFALRSLWRTPAFVAAVVTIAVGIGATTAILTAVDRIVLRPLPFPESERAVVVCETSARTANVCVASPANVADWGRAVPALDAIGVVRAEPSEITLGGRTFSVPGAIASPGYFSALGIRPIDGRLLEEADLDSARDHVLVVSDEFWRERLASKPRVVGTSITVNGRPFRIVGRLPANAYLPSFDEAQVWKPITAGVDDASNRSWRGFLAVGRLSRGVTLGEMRTQLDSVRAHLAIEFPAANAGWGVRAMPLREYVVGPTSTTLWLFSAAVGLLLLIACANVAGLLLVRVSIRAPEFALRASLGAGRGRLARQLLTESAVIAMAGGVAGWLLGSAGTRVLVRLAPATIPRLGEVAADGRIALATFALTALTALVVGLAPLRVATSQARLTEALKANRRSDATGARVRALVVVTEVALSMVLLVMAGQLTRTFARLTAWSPGFDRSGVSMAWMLVPPTEGTTARAAVATLERAREQAAAVPGVAVAALGSAGPLFGGVETGSVSVEGRPAAAGDDTLAVTWFDIDPNYFSAIGRRMLAGRDVSAADVDGAPPVAVVNETFVARVFHGADPIGRRVVVQAHPADIVGIVSDVRPVQPGRATPAEIFWPIRQYPRLGAYLILRAAPGTTGVDTAVHSRVPRADASITIGPFTSLQHKFEAELIGPRFDMLLVGAFAFVAITLAAVGLYGVVEHSVASQTREIGLRLALGAPASRLVRTIVLRASALALTGITAGVAATVVLGSVLASIDSRVSGGDPIVLSTTVAGFLAVTTLAAYLPARRASRVDPLRALRSE